MKLIIAALALLALTGCASNYNKGVNLQSSGKYQQAYNEYTVAANAGDHNAMNNMGVLLENGRVVIVDGSERMFAALSWYTLAARYGNPIARQNLARLGAPIPPADLYIAPAPQGGGGWEQIAIAGMNAAADVQSGHLDGQQAGRDRAAADQAARSAAHAAKLQRMEQQRQTQALESINQTLKR